jgi:hypothetical protein
MAIARSKRPPSLGKRYIAVVPVVAGY